MFKFGEYGANFGKIQLLSFLLAGVPAILCGGGAAEQDPLRTTSPSPSPSPFRPSPLLQPVCRHLPGVPSSSPANFPRSVFLLLDFSAGPTAALAGVHPSSPRLAVQRARRLDTPPPDPTVVAALRIKNCLTQLYAKNITPDDKQELNETLQREDLRLGNDEMTRLKNADAKKMLLQKRLYLVIDLDHTVLNSTRLEDIKPDEE